MTRSKRPQRTGFLPRLHHARRHFAPMVVKGLFNEETVISRLLARKPRNRAAVSRAVGVSPGRHCPCFLAGEPRPSYSESP